MDVELRLMNLSMWSMSVLLSNDLPKAKCFLPKAVYFSTNGPAVYGIPSAGGFFAHCFGNLAPPEASTKLKLQMGLQYGLSLSEVDLALI